MKSGPLGETGRGFPILLQSEADARRYVGELHDGIPDSISRYADQADLHTAICSPLSTHRRMEKTPDQRREILRDFIKANSLKIAGWAKRSGVDKNSIYNFLNGHSNSLAAETYAKLARTARVPSHKLTGDQPEAPSPTQVVVRGGVQAGVFKEAVEWDERDWFAIDVPIPSRFLGRAHGLKVCGQSMNRIYPEGTIAIWVRMLDYRPPRDGDNVVVYSTRQDDLIEATLKQYRVTEDGDQWLWPQSTDPNHQAPVNTFDPPEEIKEIEVVGIVLGSYRPEHF